MTLRGKHSQPGRRFRTLLDKKRWTLLLKRTQEVGQAKLRDIVGLVLDHAFEDLRDDAAGVHCYIRLLDRYRGIPECRHAIK